MSMSTPEQRKAYVEQAEERLAAMTPEARVALEESFRRHRAKCSEEHEFALWLHRNRYRQGW